MSAGLKLRDVIEQAEAEVFTHQPRSAVGSSLHARAQLLLAEIRGAHKPGMNVSFGLTYH